MAFREDHTMFLGNFTLKVVEIIDRQVMRLGVGWKKVDMLLQF